MSQIFRCDFCNDITDDIAAQVIFKFSNSILRQATQDNGMDLDWHTTSGIRQNKVAQMAEMADTRDCCGNCIEKFFPKKPIRIIDNTAAATQTTEDVPQNA